MVSIKVGDINLDIAEEIINIKIVIDALLTALGRRGILTQEEFDKIRKEYIEIFKKEHPEIFPDNPPKK